MKPKSKLEKYIESIRPFSTWCIMKPKSKLEKYIESIRPFSGGWDMSSHAHLSDEEIFYFMSHPTSVPVRRLVEEILVLRRENENT